MLEVKNLSFHVSGESGETDIIDNVSFSVKSGEFIVITGPNGGGKSTLAKLIMGIEKPTGGQILFEGKDIAPLSVTERALLGIGYAFQQPPRFKGLTIRSLLSLAHGSELPEDKCCDYLTRVGLCSKEYLNREVDSSLSGGEVKRIEIAGLLARDLKLTIFDEPEAGIDLWSFSMLIDSFKKLAEGREKTIIIISHQERIMSLADRLIVVANGTIRSEGSAAELLPKLAGEFDDDCGFEKEV